MDVVLGIGDRLREARLRRGLDLDRAQAETRIRARYLEALEEEQFGELPGEAYAKGMLRSYGSYLGLDGGELLALYKERHAPQEPPPVAPRPEPPPALPLLRLGGLAGAVVLAAGAVGIVGWRLGDGSGPERAAAPAPTQVVTVTRPAAEPAAPAAAAPEKAEPAAPPPPLVLTAVDETWLEVRLGGKLLWVGTLQRGRSLKLGLRKPLRLVVGRPASLRASLGTKGIPVPGANVLVATRKGLRAA